MRVRSVPLLMATALALAAFTAGCGDSVTKAPATAAVGSPQTASSSASPPAPATSPPHTATPALTASSTPAPSPTPAELTLTASDDGGGTSTPASAGPLGVKYAMAGFGFGPRANRLQPWATVYVGVNEHPSASVWLYNDFAVPGKGSTTVTAQISTQVSWKGVLAGNGAAGTGAAITITLSVLDGSTTVGSQVVHTIEQKESALTVGGFDDISSAPASLQVLLVPERTYQLRLTATCAASSGLVGAATYCVFGKSDLYAEGYVDWGARTILFGS